MNAGVHKGLGSALHHRCPLLPHWGWPLLCSLGSWALQSKTAQGKRSYGVSSLSQLLEEVIPWTWPPADPWGGSWISAIRGSSPLPVLGTHVCTFRTFRTFRTFLTLCPRFPAREPRDVQGGSCERATPCWDHRDGSLDLAQVRRRCEPWSFWATGVAISAHCGFWRQDSCVRSLAS